MLRYLATLLIIVIWWPTLVPFTSKDRVTYQINGKITMSKEKEIYKKDFWVGIMLLITCSISNKTSFLFSKINTYTFKTSYKTWKHFQKINIFVYILTNENHYKDFLNNGLFYKILSKPHQAQFQTTKESDLESN